MNSLHEVERHSKYPFWAEPRSSALDIRPWPCLVCGGKSQWAYGTEDGWPIGSDKFYCDEHVPPELLAPYLMKNLP